MTQILVVYFSRCGAVERLAQHLAAQLDADLEPIFPEGHYAGPWGYLRAVWHSVSGGAPVVRTARSPQDYAVTVIATPVWAGRLAAPVRGYLKHAGSRIDTYAAVWVSGSGGAYKAVADEVSRLVGRAPLATAWFGEAEVRNGPPAERVKSVVDAVKNAQARIDIDAETPADFVWNGD